MKDPKEQAEELIEKFRYNDEILQSRMPEYIAKQCALICVDEILKTDEYLTDYIYINYESPYKYWQKVKKEIEEL